MHPETLIRDAIVNWLLGNPQPEGLSPVYPITGVEDRIFANRSSPFFESQADYICVYNIDTQPLEEEGSSETIIRSDSGIVVEIVSATLDNIDERIDNIAKLVLKVLSNKGILYDPVTYAQLRVGPPPLGHQEAFDGAAVSEKFFYTGRYQKGFAKEETGKLVASGKIYFQAHYTYEVTEPGETLEDFNRLVATYEQVGHTPTSPVVRDDIQIP